MLLRHYESRGVLPYGYIEIYLDLITNRYSYQLYAETSVGDLPIYDTDLCFETLHAVYDDAYVQAELNKLWEYRSAMEICYMEEV